MTSEDDELCPHTLMLARSVATPSLTFVAVTLFPLVASEITPAGEALQDTVPVWAASGGKLGTRYVPDVQMVPGPEMAAFPGATVVGTKVLVVNVCPAKLTAQVTFPIVVAVVLGVIAIVFVVV